MMNKFLILGALPAVLGSRAHDAQTTKTVYATKVHTVTSCGPQVTNCPARGGPVIVTEVVAVSTTVCAVTEVETSTKAPASCSTATSVSDCVHTITKTAPAFVVTTKAPATTITKKETLVSTSTCVHTIPGHGKDEKDMTVTTEILTTTVKDKVTTSYTDCVHTVTGATSLLVVTTAIPTTYTVCPLKPTWPAHPEEPESPAKPTGSWPHHDEPEAPVKPTGTWSKPEVTGVAPVKPVGTGAWTKTVDGNKAVVTAGAAAFGAAGAIKMLGAAAAAALLL
jgi:hypothetical protein